MKAKFTGKCSGCNSEIKVGEQVTRGAFGWEHSRCVPREFKPRQGENEWHKRSHQKSPWRRGKSPGSYK